MNDHTEEGEGRDLVTYGPGALAQLNRSDIEEQRDAARKDPRSIKRFLNELKSLATLNEDVAAECSYALSRKSKNGEKKVIEGPSTRFAELVHYSWRNCRAGARVIDEQADFVVAQGVFKDVEHNTETTYEVRRRITDAGGRRYSSDMVAVTANAACSIAFRNVVLKAVPKAIWIEAWEAARKAAVGDETTLSKKRLNAVRKFAALGVSEAQVLAKLELPSVADITIDNLAVLLGIYTSIKEGDSTAEQAFAEDTNGGSASTTVKDLNAAIAATKEKPPAATTEIQNPSVETQAQEGAAAPEGAEVAKTGEDAPQGPQSPPEMQQAAPPRETVNPQATQAPPRSTGTSDMPPPIQYHTADLIGMIEKARQTKNPQALDDAEDLIRSVVEAEARPSLTQLVKKVREDWKKGK